MGGEGGGGRSWDHMSSNDVGSYELKRTPCEMQIEECSATLARSTSDVSADNNNDNSNNTNKRDNAR